jgi:hypothetical protein
MRNNSPRSRPFQTSPADSEATSPVRSSASAKSVGARDEHPVAAASEDPSSRARGAARHTHGGEFRDPFLELVKTPRHHAHRAGRHEPVVLEDAAQHLAGPEDGGAVTDGVRDHGVDAALEERHDGEWIRPSNEADNHRVPTGRRLREPYQARVTRRRAAAGPPSRKIVAPEAACFPRDPCRDSRTCLGYEPVQQRRPGDDVEERCGAAARRGLATVSHVGGPDRLHPCAPPAEGV